MTDGRRDTTLRSRDLILGLLVIVGVFLIPSIHFFEAFPNGWDQTEYTWAVADSYLPHSPYVVFYLLGKAFAAVFEPAVALSALSLVSAMLALVGMASLCRRLSPDAVPADVAAWFAVAIMGGSFLFIRQAATQEVYMLELAVVVWAAAALTGNVDFRGAVGAGLLAGAGLATHNSTILVFPALAVLLLWRREARMNRLVGWAAGVALSVILGFGFLWLIFPGGAAEYLAYVRGLSSQFQFGRTLDIGFLIESFKGFAWRLTSDEIPTRRIETATSALGIWPRHAVLALVGLVVAALKARRVALFAVAWPAVFVLYELALGFNVDSGVYLVFLLPPVCLLASASLWPVLSRLSYGPFARTATALALAVIVLIPSLTLTASHWHEPEADVVAHYNDDTVTAIWASRNLEDDAIVIESREERNINLLPYYSKRRHAFWYGDRLLLFKGFNRKYTPLNLSAFEPLTTEVLASHLERGGAIYGLDANPLDGVDRAALNDTLFEWEEGPVVPLGEVASSIGAPTTVQSSLQDRTKQLYRVVRK